MDMSGNNATPLFSAVSSSARQLFQLLKCISFVPKVQVRITKEGLRFTAEESQVMQGIVFLDKALFSAYTFTPVNNNEDDSDDDDDSEAPPFDVSISALLETLQIFGINDTKDRWNRDTISGGASGSFARGGPTAAFETRILGISGVCRLSYAAPGDPLCIILKETGITTTCELMTYEPEFREEIPLQKDAIAQKIIMRASWLHDAINELSSTSPTRLIIASSPTAPHFTLSSTGPLGSAIVEFTKDPQLLETFQVPKKIVNSYKYSLMKGASKAMEIASKVSIRTDEQGVLSLQFMVEIEGGGFSFIDFRFVPYILEEGEGPEESDADSDD